jgi:hypothetical protein
MKLVYHFLLGRDLENLIVEKEVLKDLIIFVNLVSRYSISLRLLLVFLLDY